MQPSEIFMEKFVFSLAKSGKTWYNIMLYEPLPSRIPSQAARDMKRRGTTATEQDEEETDNAQH